MRGGRPALSYASAALATCLLACTTTQPPAGVIRIGGSDTMVNLVQAWAEAYANIQPDVSIEVGGGGSGVGITQWLEGTLDVATTSRGLDPLEEARVAARWPAGVTVDTVALDAIAVFVSARNPLRHIRLDQLAEIYGEHGCLRDWRGLGVDNPACRSKGIIRVGRQNNSGTYLLFRAVVLGVARDYALGSIDQNGSRDVVSLVGQAPCAIGYSGMAYTTPQVRVVAVAAAGGRAVVPSPATVLDGTYPLARRLSFCTARNAPAAVHRFTAWVLGADAQRIAANLGFVSIGRDW